ncbi:MarR family transcriptional regulator [Sphingomonas sp. AR_OL41]|jgi:DNA-binding MarR family transcriptional regulator|uniref:MarR family winged helix-turn-helix transcriptional regulator n=1 Tax=Sphingomonas sp. AR_OL41 TaxID=3042729 RepID=UPI002480F610|nr:MarR family transcriptional regulator [Sphingomonas sp. AR_OL41]MDH7975734.1 MarR family transcriptional regulator [Sphingomonas sp. AR_OL41]
MAGRARFGDDAFGVIAHQVGYQLRRLDLLAMGLLWDFLTPLGVTPGRATALVFIGEHEGCDQVALARALGINRASAMAAVNELVALGAVERQPGRDRRSNALHLTPAGVALRADVEAAILHHDATVFGGLTPEEREAFQHTIHKLRALNAQGASVEPRNKRALLRRIK